MTLIAEQVAAVPAQTSVEPVVGAPGGVPGVSVQEAAWCHAEGEALAVMGVVNAGVARLVAAIGDLLTVDGWVGAGIRSPEHWVCWKAGISAGRARGLVRIARRAGELPACFALFRAGRLTEDSMVRIARHVPAARDTEVAALAPTLLIAQLDRILAVLPEQPDGTTGRPEPERTCRLREGRDGWVHGTFCLPADEGAVVRLGLLSGRDAEFRDRNGLAPDDDAAPADARQVSWADGLVRMASEAADALDPALRRTNQRGGRNTVVLHHDIDRDGTLGAGQLEYGPIVPDTVARYLACDAHVQVMCYQAGRLIGINPTERTPNRATRHYLARRDQGCIHPLCDQTLWVHAHHIVHWEDNGPTIPQNLILLCPAHHRALHLGHYRVEGDPEAGTLRFLDTWGTPIRAPNPRPPDPGGDPPTARPSFIPPLGEFLPAHSFTWN
jgi:hypothetical protein